MKKSYDEMNQKEQMESWIDDAYYWLDSNAIVEAAICFRMAKMKAEEVT